ncbi:MAG: DNA-processing protein DprA [Trueperaceae bacterium]
MSSFRHAPAETGFGREAPNPERSALYQAALSARSGSAARLRPLVQEFGSLDRALEATPAALSAPLGMTAGAARAYVNELRAGVARATRQIAAALARGLHVITWEDAGYPPALHDDPVGCAPLLYIEGRLPAQLAYPSRQLRSCAVIGTRRATPGALGFTRDLTRALTREGLVVVSGLALGIDGAAHEGALQALELPDEQLAAAAAQRTFDWRADQEATSRPAPTVAVLGGGHGHLHPAAHTGLARRIVATGGAVVSEWPPDMAPRKHTFLRRNRVISGLAKAVLVVEAGLRSGTNSTVAHALEQGRDLLAVPAAPWSAAGAGCLALVNEGAELVYGYADVMAQYEQFVAVRLQGEPSDSAPPGALQPGLGLLRPPASSANSGSVHQQVLETIRERLSPTLDFSLDALVGLTPYSASVLIGVMTTLELLGAVEPTDGGRYRLRDPLPQRRQRRE